jgi:hypothetical protein
MNYLVQSLKNRLPPWKARLEHYVPLLVWVLVALTLFFIPFKIVSLGFIPPDDASRHAAKAISEKSWPEILVMRPDITLDQHLGWHTILNTIYHTFGLTVDSLVVVSVVSLSILFSLCLLLSFRRVEAVAFSLLICMVTFPGSIYRQLLGRPYIVSMSALVILFILWTNRDRITVLRCCATALLLTLTIWIHGTCWYFFLLPIGSFFLAGYIRQAFALTACWAAGTLGAATLTGSPITFLVEQIRQIGLAMGGQTLTRMLVTEFQPSDGSFGFVLALAVLIILQKLIRGNWDLESFHTPIFIMGTLGWILGFKVVRFWIDWGAPALLLWMISQIQTLLVWKLGYQSVRRLAFTFLGCAALFLSISGDLRGRWTDNLTIIYMDGADKKISDWMPGKGGIMYSADMGVFYETFYKNPKAPWRYILGFEPGLMPADDLKTYRSIQWRYLDAAYDPWVKKMRPEDRLVIRGVSGNKPSIPDLDWFYIVHGTWIGRLPVDKKNPAEKDIPKPSQEKSEEPQKPMPPGRQEGLRHD